MIEKPERKRYYKATLWISSKEAIIFDNPVLLAKWQRKYPKAHVEYPKDQAQVISINATGGTKNRADTPDNSEPTPCYKSMD